MSTRKVSTRRELKRELDIRTDKIIVTGELVEEIKAASKVESFNVAAIGVLTTAISKISLSEMGNAIAMTAVAATTGINVKGIGLIATIGVLDTLAIFNEYDVRECGIFEAKLKLVKKRSF